MKFIKIVFFVAITFVLLAKIMNWFMHFSDHVNHIITTFMFILIGIAYMYEGINYNSNWKRITTIACGVFLIAMNFLEKNFLLQTIAVVCLIIPRVINYYATKKEKHETSPLP